MLKPFGPSGKPTKMTILRLETKDGLSGVQSYVKIGDEYEVYLESERPMDWGNVDSDIVIKRPSVWCGPLKNNARGGYMPLELFK